MNIHLPAILMFTRGTRFWHTAISRWFSIVCPFNHHFNQRVNSPLLWGDLGSVGRGHPWWFPWCIHNVSVNIAATPGMVLEIHIIYILYIYHLISYHIISYYIILCIYKSNSLQHVCCTEYLITYIYIIVYIRIFVYIRVYIYIYTRYMSFWGNILY